jgi:thiol-disulfide isomerase/thioredoxin
VEASDGTTLSSKSYLGKVVVVNFWYASCPPCIAEAPTLSSLATTYAGKVQFIGVDVSDDSETTGIFEKNHKTPYPSIVDQAGGASVQLAFASIKPPKAVPSTFVLDRKGRVTARMVGLANKSNLNQLIEDTVDGTAK